MSVSDLWASGRPGSKLVERFPTALSAITTNRIFSTNHVKTIEATFYDASCKIH